MRLHLLITEECGLQSCDFAISQAGIDNNPESWADLLSDTRALVRSSEPRTPTAFGVVTVDISEAEIARAFGRGALPPGRGRGARKVV
jgi:hypothetical protein